jgi:hypothetical protein
MSRITTSGSRSRTCSIAVAPSAASPHTSQPSVSTMRRTPRRTISWSSTTSIRNRPTHAGTRKHIGSERQRYRVFSVILSCPQGQRVDNQIGVSNTRQLTAPFLHVLVFECPRCFGPVCLPTLHSAANLESVDAERYNLRCSCGWNGNLPGIQARKHFVDSWNLEISNTPVI